MIKRTDVAVETIVKDYADGKFPGGKTVTLGLAEDGVGLSPIKIYPRSHSGGDASQGRKRKKGHFVGQKQSLERGRAGLSGLLQMIERARVAIRLGARNVTRRFGSVVANDRVDLAVAPGTDPRRDRRRQRQRAEVDADAYPAAASMRPMRAASFSTTFPFASPDRLTLSCAASAWCTRNSCWRRT